MRKYYYISILIVSLTSQLSSQHWVEQSSGTQRIINGISFVDSLSGFLVTMGQIIKTTDGGNQWINNFSDDTYLFYDIDCYDSLYCFTVGWCDEYLGCTGGIAMKSSNGGNSWINLHPYGYPNGNTFLCWYFSSKNVGYIGGGIIIRKTTDFGNSWENSEIYRSIHDFSFIDSLTGWAVGYPQVVYKTTDAGNNWFSLSAGIHHIEFSNVIFLNQQIGYITESGYRGLIKSTDGGNTWNGTGYPADEIFFADSLNGWLLGENTLFNTTDGGNTWIFLTEVPTNYSVSKMAVIDRKHIWVAGENGSILKYTDPNVTDIEVGENDSKPSKYNMSQNYPNPFNPSTKISYQIPKLSFVTLKVYDVLGNDITTLVEEEKPAGSYEVEFDGSGIPSGIYFYRLQAGSYVDTKKMVILK